METLLSLPSASFLFNGKKTIFLLYKIVTQQKRLVGDANSNWSKKFVKDKAKCYPETLTVSEMRTDFSPVASM